VSNEDRLSNIRYRELHTWATRELGFGESEARKFCSDFEIDSVTGWITYRGYLDLEGKPLTRLPERMRVEGTLGLQDCTHLAFLPKGLKTEWLILEGCTSLTELPVDLDADVIEADHCINLTSIPENLAATLLSLAGCTGLVALPERLRVEQLSLEDCTNLRCLPADMGVVTDLNLRGCTGLTSLPPNLSISSLCLEKCANLNEVPRTVRVRGGSGDFAGQLFLWACKGLEAFYSSDPERILELAEIAEGLSLLGWQKLSTLPAGLHLRGDLDLSNCPNIDTLPSDLRVEGTLRLANSGGLERYYCGHPERFHDLASKGRSLAIRKWSALRVLPRRLLLAGSLHLHDCESLVEIGDGMSVGDSLSLSYCGQIRSLPSELRLNSLCVKGCDNLRTLPAGLVVRDKVFLSDCRELSVLPFDISAEGDLAILRCPSIQELPADLKVGGNLRIISCKGLGSLPGNLKIAGDLELADCPNLEPLPQSIEVGGAVKIGSCEVMEEYYCANPERLLDLAAICDSLRLTGWDKLTALPSGLNIYELRLESCELLAWLPTGLRVAGDLFLWGCEKITRLPDDLFVGGDLYTSENLFDNALELKSRGQVRGAVMKIVPEQGPYSVIVTSRL